MIKDLSHLAALQQRLSHEKKRMERASSGMERGFRIACIRQIEREISAEMIFLGVDPIPSAIESMTDDDLLSELGEYHE